MIVRILIKHDSCIIYLKFNMFWKQKTKDFLFEPPTVQLYQKQYLHFCGMELSKMQTIVVTVIAGFLND